MKQSPSYPRLPNLNFQKEYFIFYEMSENVLLKFKQWCFSLPPPPPSPLPLSKHRWHVPVKNRRLCCDRFLEENHIVIQTESFLSIDTFYHTFFKFDGKCELDNKICVNFNVSFDYFNLCIASLTSFYAFQFLLFIEYFLSINKFKEN